MTDKYFEVDISFSSTAKMVLLGSSEDQIAELVQTEFSDIPDLEVLSIQEASPELVAEAQARRAFEDAKTNEFGWQNETKATLQ